MTPSPVQMRTPFASTDRAGLALQPANDRPVQLLRVATPAQLEARAEVRAQAAERLTFAAERRAFAVERRRWARVNSLVWLMVAVAFVMLAFKVAGA